MAEAHNGDKTEKASPHKLREALTYADDVTALRRGEVVLSAAAAAVTVDGLVEATASLPLGAVRTTETHILGHRDVPKAIESLRRHARRCVPSNWMPDCPR